MDEKGYNGAGCMKVNNKLLLILALALMLMMSVFAFTEEAVPSPNAAETPELITSSETDDADEADKAQSGVEGAFSDGTDRIVTGTENTAEEPFYPEDGGNEDAQKASEVSDPAVTDINADMPSDTDLNANVQEGEYLTFYGLVEVHEEADENSRIFAVYENGARLFAVPAEGDWIAVIIQNKTGFVRKESLIAPAHSQSKETDEDRLYDGKEKIRKAPVSSSLGKAVEKGETICLSVDLGDFADCSEVFVIWEVNSGDGWVQAAEGQTFEYQASVESLRWNFRARVFFTP